MDLLLPHFGLIFWTMLSFIIVLLILKKFAWSPILTSLNEREKSIADSIALAEKVNVEMAQLKIRNKNIGPFFFYNFKYVSFILPQGWPNFTAQTGFTAMPFCSF